MPTISEAESRVMEVLWQRAPQASDEVVAALRTSTDWHEKTIRTLLNRLLGKGAISAEREGRRYLYSPVLTREAWQAQDFGAEAHIFSEWTFGLEKSDGRLRGPISQSAARPGK